MFSYRTTPKTSYASSVDALSDRAKLWNPHVSTQPSPLSRNYFPKLNKFYIGRRKALVITAILSILSTTILTFSFHNSPVATDLGTLLDDYGVGQEGVIDTPSEC